MSELDAFKCEKCGKVTDTNEGKVVESSSNDLPLGLCTDCMLEDDS